MILFFNRENMGLALALKSFKVTSIEQKWDAEKTSVTLKHFWHYTKN